MLTAVATFGACRCVSEDCVRRATANEAQHTAVETPWRIWEETVLRKEAAALDAADVVRSEVGGLSPLPRHSMVVIEKVVDTAVLRGSKRGGVYDKEPVPTPTPLQTQTLSPRTPTLLPHSLTSNWRCSSASCHTQMLASRASQTHAQCSRDGAGLAELVAFFEALVALPSDINEHLPTLREYARSVQSVAELGVRGVISTNAFLLGLAERQAERPSGATLTCVDLQPTNVSVPARLGNMLGVHVSFKQADSATVELPPRELLFIDTWHIYGHLRRELAAHHATTSKYIVLHDTVVDGVRGESLRLGEDTAAAARDSGYEQWEIEMGLQPAVDEFLAAHAEWSIERHDEHNNGLTVLVRRGTASVTPPGVTLHFSVAPSGA